MHKGIDTNKDVLNTVYALSEKIEYKVDENNIVTIMEKQDHKVQRIFRKIGFRIPEYKNLELDEYASFVFININGKNTVEEIALLLKEKYKEAAEPLYERLLLFLNHLEVNLNIICKK